jgi:acetylornithine deacetylase
MRQRARYDQIRHLYARFGGLDTVVFGSGDLSQVHSDHEVVELDQVTRGIAILGGVLSVN